MSSPAGTRSGSLAALFLGGNALGGNALGGKLLGRQLLGRQFLRQQGLRRDLRPLGEDRRTRRLEARLGLAACLELFDGLEATVEDLLRTTLCTHLGAQRLGGASIDLARFRNHDAVTACTADGDEPRGHIERHLFGCALERIAPTTTAPGVGDQQITGLDLDVIDL